MSHLSLRRLHSRHDVMIRLRLRVFDAVLTLPDAGVLAPCNSGDSAIDLKGLFVSTLVNLHSSGSAFQTTPERAKKLYQEDCCKQCIADIAMLTPAQVADTDQDESPPNKQLKEHSCRNTSRPPFECFTGPDHLSKQHSASRRRKLRQGCWYLGSSVDQGYSFNPNPQRSRDLGQAHFPFPSPPSPLTFVSTP